MGCRRGQAGAMANENGGERPTQTGVAAQGQHGPALEAKATEGAPGGSAKKMRYTRRTKRRRARLKRANWWGRASAEIRTHAYHPIVYIRSRLEQDGTTAQSRSISIYSTLPPDEHYYRQLICARRGNEAA